MARLSSLGTAKPSRQNAGGHIAATVPVNLYYRLVWWVE